MPLLRGFRNTPSLQVRFGCTESWQRGSPIFDEDRGRASYRELLEQPELSCRADNTVYALADESGCLCRVVASFGSHAPARPAKIVAIVSE
jgi:hypothetical protein